MADIISIVCSKENLIVNQSKNKFDTVGNEQSLALLETVEPNIQVKIINNLKNIKHKVINK